MPARVKWFQAACVFHPEDDRGGRVKAIQPRAGAGEDDSAADAAMERYANGDLAAFEIVYGRLAPRLIAFLRRHARDEGVVQDAVQQTFLNIHRGRATFRPGTGLFPWALAIARSVLRERWRRPRLEVVSDPTALGEADAAPSSPEPSRSVEAREMARLAEKYLQRLSMGQRLPYELVKLEGLTYVEAAQVMGTTVMTVKLRVHRVTVALRALRATVEER
jgi:RNA polymerase sigma-70 factor (ECF subfamily)